MSNVTEIAPDVPAGLERGLRNYWYPILQSEEVGIHKPVGVTVFGEKYVVWRDADARPAVLADRCPHRATQLSIGRVLDGQLQCAFHGLRFGRTGRCELIPWEPEDSPLRDEVHVSAYPAQDLGGYIWAYLGDTEAFPPPPLEDEIPEELLHPDEYLWFRMATEVWDANWLLAIDGGDAFHAVTLHAETQAVADTSWQGGRPAEAGVALAERRVKIVEGSYGIRAIATDRQGNPIHHGHLLRVKGERFILPCISSNVIRPVPGVPAYVSRLWQFPRDDKHTIIVRFVCEQASSDEQRERWTKLFEDVVKPRLLSISKEDALVAASQGDLVSARSNEHLFEPDKDMYKIRRQIKDAYLRQMDGRRISPTREALVFPVEPD